jgi:hypothetical protein
MLNKAIRLVLMPAAAAVVVACGGGGGGQQSTVLTGTAAVGAAVDAATVNVYDSTGKLVGTGTTGADGNFSITLTENGKAPYVLKLVKDEITLHALHADAGNGVVNITPFSDGVVSMLSPTGSSSGLISALQEGATAPTAALIKERREVVSTALGGMMTAAGVTGDIFTTAFSTNGTGQDKLLDSVSVNSIADGEAKVANLQLTLKLATDPENPSADMPVINLSSSSSVAEALSEKNRIGVISPQNLPSDEAGKLYTSLIANLNACYKEAPEVRTDGSSNVLSSACTKVFVDNDPSKYLNFGQKLGATAQFAGMFTYTGAVDFKPVSKPYLAQDLKGAKSVDGRGRAIVAMSWVNEQGNRENIMLYATKYTLKGEELLGLSGDKNSYPWTVVSHNQKREFPLRNNNSMDYVQSQYLISVRDLINKTTGKSDVNYAIVTTPSKKKVLLASAKGGASRDLALCRATEVDLVAGVPTNPKNSETDTYPANGPQAALAKYWCTGTSKSLTFAQSFVDKTMRATYVPSDIKDVGILRPLNNSGQPYTPTSAELANFPSMGMWTIEYKFMDGSTKTQKTWSVARPMTVEELLGSDGPDAVMPKYTEATINWMKALKTQSGNVLTACPSGSNTCDAAQSPVPAPLSGGYKFAWTDSPVPMTSLWLSGAKNDAGRTWISGTNASRWDDQLGVRSTTRQAELKCSRQSQSDGHCADGVAVSDIGGFNSRIWTSYSELWGKDAEQRNMMRSYNWYQPLKQDNTPF